jgi:hypothetical protein
MVADAERGPACAMAAEAAIATSRDRVLADLKERNMVVSFGPKSRNEVF